MRGMAAIDQNSPVGLYVKVIPLPGGIHPKQKWTKICNISKYIPHTRQSFSSASKRLIIVIIIIIVAYM